MSDSLGAPLAGRLFLIASSVASGEIARVLREGCDARRLAGGLRRLIQALELDLLILDTHMRPDQRDYAGTAATVEVSGALDVPRTLLLVNRVPALFG